VYEEETELFLEDLSLQVIPDDVFSRLLTFPNVVITGHQAFLTKGSTGAHRTNYDSTILLNLRRAKCARIRCEPDNRAGESVLAVG